MIFCEGCRGITKKRVQGCGSSGLLQGLGAATARCEWREALNSIKRRLEGRLLVGKRADFGPASSSCVLIHANLFYARFTRKNPTNNPAHNTVSTSGTRNTFE